MEIPRGLGGGGGEVSQARNRIAQEKGPWTKVSTNKLSPCHSRAPQIQRQLLGSFACAISGSHHRHFRHPMDITLSGY